MLWINQAAAPAAELPFGGLKDSGYGSEGGSEAVEAHLNTRLVSIERVTSLSVPARCRGPRFTPVSACA